jgi:glycosyltransferase involved in cell wall biosynthesis
VPTFSYLVLSLGITPSVYYYFQTRANLQNDVSIECIDVSTCDLQKLTVDKNTVAVINRYAGIRGLFWMYRHHHQLAKVAYFIDDDMPRAYRAAELSWWYGIKTTLKFQISWWVIRRIGGELWCSTQALANRFPKIEAKVIPPVCLPAVNSNIEESPVYFYHGTWAHRHEIAWLVPIVKEIQKRFPAHVFEIIGNRKVKKMFAGIPRVRILSGMDWEKYLEYSEKVHYQVGLAPCFNTPFNQSRSHTKLFDITRTGAVGVYSNVSPYQDVIADGHTGILVENNTQDWVEAISKLLNTPAEERGQMHKNALIWCKDNLENTPLPEHSLPS